MNHSQKVLVAYCLKSGASEEYATVIGETLTSHHLSVELCNLSSNIPDVTSFDIIVLGAGVRMSRVYRTLKKVLKQKEIKNKELFMFLSSGMALEEPDKAVEKYLQPLVKKYDLAPDLIISFPGKIPKKWAKYDQDQKLNVKPELAKKWAEEIITTIHHES